MAGLVPTSAAGLAFAVALALLGLQRIGELLYARRTARGLLARGARFVRDDGMGAILLVHATFFAATLAEAALRGPGLGWWSLAAAPAFVAGQLLRYGSMHALGPRWNTRVYVLPQAPLVATGPYRFLRHPIYLGVFLELAAFPLAFGLWWSAAAVAALHVPALLRRVRKEERALGIAP